MSVTSDPYAKLARADVHIHTLDCLIKGFAAKAYRVYAEPEVWSNPEKGGADIIVWAEALAPPPLTSGGRSSATSCMTCAPLSTNSSGR